MFLIQAIVRPEKVSKVMSDLLDAGFPGMTKMEVFGRGKQRGIKIGDIHYDEIPKEMLMVAVADEHKDEVIRTILRGARTGENGHFGDGRIFVVPIASSYTISTGEKDPAV
ncbi:MAG: P-II family nitrogen regulator [Candidatus Methanoplasma sp.]|jgi:nitrogen regulatory protein PII 1|nr:P-II family nitrogen regulator [Candidatus Methanoplasma sp.]